MSVPSACRLAWRAWSVAGTVALASCSGVTEACTLIGCTSGLHVRLEQRPELPFRVEVSRSAAPGEPRHVAECTTTTPCGGTIFFSGYTGDEAQVTVTTGAGVVTTAVRPRYEVTRPNGPRCEPECRQATVRVPVPR